ncbi:2'-5' RNA ligase [Thalassotalea sp. 42_200_T64]|nr:2'-5' RNA ligase [Thalassotalea sp. 42_200_T64]
MHRCFFGLNPNTVDKNIIAGWRGKCLPENNKNVAVNNFHITLAFLGNINSSQIKQLIDSANDIKLDSGLINIHLNQLGFWAKPKVLFLATTKQSKALVKLANSCMQVAVNADIKVAEHKPYVAHLTLARKVKYLPILDSAIDNTVNFQLEFQQFCLFESLSTPNGVKYRVIKSWPLHPIS